MSSITDPFVGCIDCFDSPSWTTIKKTMMKGFYDNNQTDIQYAQHQLLTLIDKLAKSILRIGQLTDEQKTRLLTSFEKIDRLLTSDQGISIATFSLGLMHKHFEKEIYPLIKVRT